MAWEKGKAQTVDVPTWKDGILTAPSGTVTATIIKDGAGPVALNGTVVKVGTSPALHLALSADDTDCECGLVLITDPGLAIDDVQFSFTTESGYTAALAASLLTIPADLLTAIVTFADGTTKTVEEALRAAWAQGAGSWDKDGTSLLVMGPDANPALPEAAFTLDDATAPTQRTAV